MIFGLRRICMLPALAISMMAMTACATLPVSGFGLGDDPPVIEATLDRVEQAAGAAEAATSAAEALQVISPERARDVRSVVSRVRGLVQTARDMIAVGNSAQARRLIDQAESLIEGLTGGSSPDDS